MNNYQLMESFLAYIRQLALDNPTKYMSNEIIYSALIGYNMCDYNKPFENITDKYPYLYQH